MLCRFGARRRAAVSKWDGARMPAGGSVEAGLTKWRGFAPLVAKCRCMSRLDP